MLATFAVDAQGGVRGKPMLVPLDLPFLATAIGVSDSYLVVAGHTVQRRERGTFEAGLPPGKGYEGDLPPAPFPLGVETIAILEDVPVPAAAIYRLPVVDPIHQLSPLTSLPSVGFVQAIEGIGETIVVWLYSSSDDGEQFFRVSYASTDGGEITAGPVSVASATAGESGLWSIARVGDNTFVLIDGGEFASIRTVDSDGHLDDGVEIDSRQSLIARSDREQLVLLGTADGMLTVRVGQNGKQRSVWLGERVLSVLPIGNSSGEAVAVFETSIKIINVRQ